jgi:formylmethanofuran dehydrogenase subunit E
MREEIHRHHSAGMLHHLIILKVNERPHTGYSLAKAIQAGTGRKPSWGSIYPLLEHLKKEGLVSVSAEGRKKNYTITKEGRRLAQSFHQHHEKLIDTLLRDSRTVCEITGQDPDMLLEMFNRFKHEEDPLRPISDKALRLRRLILQMAHDGRIERNKQRINTILSDTIKRLERIR